MGLGGIGWFLPLDKNLPESGILGHTAADKIVRSTPSSVELQGDELGWLVAYVGQGVGVAAGEPLHVAGLENARHGALAYHVAAHLQVGYRDQQVRAGVVMAG